MIKIYLPFLVSIGVLFFTASCKKYTDPPPYFEEDSTTTIIGKRKVLLIGIDGFSGKEFKALNLPTLNSMLEKSKYTVVNAVDDAVTTDAASWKTLLSGVNFSKHMVRDSSFESLLQPEEGQAGTNYPSLFYFIIRSARPDLQSRIVSDWPDMLSLLTPEASARVATQNDVATKDSVISALKTKNDDLLVVHFNSASIAGKAGSFSASDNGYKDATLKIDSYISDIMTALKERPQYNKEEDWLVIITGTHGGKGNEYGGNSDEEIMVPAIYYHEKMKSTEFVKADYSSVVISGRDADAINATVADANAYNMGTGNQTIQIKIKGSGPFNWPHFMGKTTGFTENGWTMFTNSTGSWCFSIKGSNTNEKRLQVTTPNLFDNNWHTITTVIYDSAGNKWVKRFMDGARIQDDNGTRNLGADPGSISSTDPLMIGWGDDRGMGAMTFNVADFEIYNTALSDDEVRSNTCLKDISKHPKYANLIGYWPCYDGFGSGFKNLAPGMSEHSLGLSGSYLWNADPIIPCTITATPSNSNNAQIMLSSAGVPSTIFYWLRISVNARWGIEPSNWLSLYETEFIDIQ